jgi:tRNA threonylcarbamoyladenosine biosynthesis protein TsaE
MVAAMLAPPDSTTLALPTLAATEALAARLAPLLRSGDVVLLQGPLGAGKTAFARALLRALTGDPALDVPSPSFTLVQSYDTPAGPVHHYDLWRIDRADDLAELGLEEAVRDIALIEWPERLGETPPEALTIALAIGLDDSRSAKLSGPPALLAGLAIA